MSGKIATSTVTDGLVLYLDAANPSSYPGSGTTWFDLTTNGNTGVLTNGPTFNSANAGSIVFDGVNDYYVQTTAAYKNYTTITATVWMFLISYTSTFETYFAYNSEEGALTQGWGVRRSGGSEFQYWGGTGNTGIKLYIDGVLRDSSNATAANLSGYNTVGAWRMITLVATGISSWNTHNRFTLATRSDALNTASNYRASNFNLYNRELSAQEILQNYNALKSRFGL